MRGRGTDGKAIRESVENYRAWAREEVMRTVISDFPFRISSQPQQVGIGQWLPGLESALQGLPILDNPRPGKINQPASTHAKTAEFLSERRIGLLKQIDVAACAFGESSGPIKVKEAREKLHRLVEEYVSLSACCPAGGTHTLTPHPAKDAPYCARCGYGK